MDFNLFKKEYFDLSGVDLNKYHLEQLERRLKSFLSNYFSLEKENEEIFRLAICELKKNEEFKVKIFEALTINHSYFFRNNSQWDSLLEIIKESKKNELKIWSAGCSTGEEPYTLAMLLEENFPTVKYKIYASDIYLSVLEKAKEGLYDKFSLERETDDYFLSKYFIKEEDNYKIAEKIKKNVFFERHNLLEPPPHSDFDIIICRNVLIYFSNSGKGIIFDHFASSMKDEGILFLGPTEQIFTSEKFDLDLIKPSFYIKNKR